MRLFGLDIKWAGTREGTTRAQLPIAVSRRSYEDPWGMQSSISSPVDLAVYEAVANVIPFIDVALRKLSRMIPRFEVKCRVDSTADALNAWLRSAALIARGFAPFARSHVRQMLQYGRSVGEIA